MWRKRMLETVAMLMIGDGIVQVFAPRRHMSLWDTGSNAFGRVARFGANYANLVRLLGATETTLDLWLALAQYRYLPPRDR